MSRFTVPASSGWVTSYYWVDETHLVISDACDIDSWRWVADAACAGVDPEAFFRTGEDTETALLARLCRSCPVQQECLEYALLNEEYGWWGGTTRRERRELMKGLANG